LLNRIICAEPKLSIYDSVELVNKNDWEKVAGNKNIFLSLPYLQALESAMEGEMEFRYIIYYNNLLLPVAISYIQLVHFVEKGGVKYQEIFCKVADKIKNKLLESIDVKILVCGNIFACGENGFAYTASINSDDAFELLSGSLKRLSQEKELNGQISFILLKEFWPQSVSISNVLNDKSYRGFNIDVNMVMQIAESWKSIEDYLSSMNTKFRTKAKGVYKKTENLSILDFDTEQIIQYQAEIEKLYSNVVSKAEYNLSKLNAKVFLHFKEKLKSQFIFKAYFIESKMVGFSSIFYFNNIVDANYVGIDYTYNKEFAIYQRMLYDFVAISIELGANELRLGRTAELIKSSIGALPVQMKLYAKHRNGISNQLLAPFISTISPSSFEIRTPFKNEIL
jgi:hypothetical protein